jgi:hypothetical protein
MSTYPKVRLLLLFVLLCTATQYTSAQTFFGTASSVPDGGSALGTTATIAPPASMQAGDLVIVYLHYRTTGGAITVSTQGGQTWNVGTANDGGTVQRYAIAWCRFNGTWSVNPIFTGANSGSVALTAVMYVFRPTNPNNSWAVHVAQANSNGNAATNQIGSVTTTFPNTVTMGFWSHAGTNTWSGLAGAGWLKTGLPNQISNLQGMDQTHTAAYQIMTAAGPTGNVTQNQTAGATVYRSSMSWHETPENNDCAGAFSVSVNTSTTCTLTTSGTTIGATQTVGGCSGNADDDVWFRFTATSASHTVSATPGGATPISNIVLQVYDACGGTNLGCSNTTSGTATESITIGGLTIGATYYYRVYSSNGTVGVRGTFTTCVSLPTPSTVLTGKSFINITRPTGGTVIPGDELEIRVSVNVSADGTRIFRTRYNDTIPTNLNYVAGSLKILTNEGKQYKAFTDAAGDDAGYYNAATRTVRFNLGKDTTSNPVGNLSSTGIDSSLGGGYFDPQFHRPRGNGVLMIVTYRVIVDAAVPYNTIFNYGGGAIRYRNQLTAPAALDYVLNPNPLTFIVYPNFGLCSNASGLNYITAGLGDFGSGVAHNAVYPGTIPGYAYAAVTTGAPGDGQYGVTKNLSPSQVTNPLVVRPQDPSVDRIFGVWDIIGDHTGAVDQLAGNPPSANGANGGYMLAVNAAYQLSVANTQAITGLCEDTYYEFSAWFRNVCKRCGSDSVGRGASGLDINVPAGYIPTGPGDSSGVRPNLTFQIDGVDYYNSGDIEYIGQWGQWVKKGFVFRTAPGQTSMTVSIKNNAPGGGGNDWVMDDISLVTCLPSLEMRPSNTPAYCNNGQVDVSVAVSTFYDNYAYYQWERSTDDGVTWGPAPELPAIQSYSYTSSGGNFLDTVALPSFLANSGVNGYRYRIRTSTSLTNISSDACAIYNATDVIRLTVNPSCDVLPAQLLHFNVQLKDSKASLLWKVKQEGNLSHYLVERSTDGRNFKSIGSVAARGASTLEEQYLFTDPALVTGKVYYRLKLEAGEGISKYSNILSVSSSQQQQFAINNLVNPFAGKISFQLETDQNGPVEIQLLDASGRPIMQKKIFANKGANAVSVDVPAYLQKGSYLLRVVSEAGIVNRVIQKQ